MITVLSGSRKITNYAAVESAIQNCGWSPSIIYHGAAVGVDTLAQTYADNHKIPTKKFPVTKAEWRTIGKRAGPLRNQRMVDAAIAAADGAPVGLVAVWDGRSSGTKGTIEYANKKGLKVYVYRT